MENTTIKINCWELKNGKDIPLLPTLTLDGFEWNAKYRLIVSNDDGSLGLPFLFAADDAAILTVTRTEQEGKKVSNKTIEQVISCVPRSLGNEITCSRIRSYNGKEHVWSAWETISSAGGIKVDWGAYSSVDTFITAGIYNIRGERLNVKDGLPIANSNPGHTINARLVVLDSSIAGTGDEQDKCITQILTLSNRTGGDGDVYIRTGRAQSTNMLAGGSGWEPWGKLQQNIEVGQVTSLDTFTGNGIYSGVYTNGSSFFETFVMVVINNYVVSGATGQVRSISQFKYALNVDGTFSYKTRIGHGNTGIEWGNWVDLGAASTTDIQDNSITVQKLSSDVREKVEKVPELEENATKEKNALVNGDTIVGLAREVYSRQGKVDTATFLKRTTAGGTSVSDGVATLKQIGGDIVMNLVDATSDNSFWGVTSFANGVFYSGPSAGGITMKPLDIINSDHKYYQRVGVYGSGNLILQDLSSENIAVAFTSSWQVLSSVSINLTKKGFTLYETNGSAGFYIVNPLLIDLTEMFGAGKEPTKEECDRMFACVGALPQGLTVAQPTGLKSTGFNQWNPKNIIAEKNVVNNAVADNVDTSIAIVECLPCKTGTGENNGYVIGYGEGDTWSDEGIEVYLTPLNPMEVDGELYLQKLDKDATYGTYVPQIKGYLLVVTPTTDKLCAHFHWSGDREITDYEEYVESNVALPTIPEMSEWGLAGLCSAAGAKAVYDTIDLENSRYTRRIGSRKIKELRWETGIATANDVSYRYYYTPDKFMQINAKCLLEGYGKVEQEALSVRELPVLAFMAYDSGRLYLRNTFSTIDEFLASEGEKRVFYELITPEEYPILTKAAPNYIGSDYGVEEFTGSKVPLLANILFYMRSLVSETRNFLDRLMAGLGTSDATAVADKIIAAVNQHSDVAETEEVVE